MPIFRRCTAVTLVCAMLLALITVGESVRSDVLTYLGEPDRQLKKEDGVEEWEYVEEKVSTMQKVPLLGFFFSGNGYEKITVIFRNNVVQSCQYREFEEGEKDWADDYSWQENDK